MDDELQNQRLEYIIEDSDISASGENADNLESNKIHGLLALVKNNQLTDSRRSYQCIKTLVTAANKSPAVKEKLLQDPEKWQWAVNWLKDKMSQGITGMGNSDVSSAVENSSYWTTSGSDGLDVLSNEDATSTRTFQRTTSAQVILEEANALLAEFGETSMGDNTSSVLMSSVVSQDKSPLQPQQYDTSSNSPQGSPYFNRQLAVVPDIDPEIGTGNPDQMDTDICETEEPTKVSKIEEDCEMPDLMNDEVKVSPGTKKQTRSTRQSKETTRDSGISD